MSTEDLAARVTELEKQCLLLMDELIHSEKRWLDARLADQAFQRAMRSLGCELAERQGVSEKLFFERFGALCRWHYDSLLRTNSDTDPEVVAELDTRRLDEIPMEDTEPRVLG